MPGGHTEPAPDADLKLVIETWLIHGDKSKAAAALGWTRSKYRHKWRVAAKRGFVPNIPAQRPNVEASFVPSSEMPNGDLIAHLAKRSAAHRARFAAEKNRRLKVDTSEPVGIVWFTDVHLGDNGVDYDLLVKHCELAANTPNTFGVFMGDASNNWPVGGKLGRMWAEQETSKAQ
jgi:hypothetical protein